MAKISRSMWGSNESPRPKAPKAPRYADPITGKRNENTDIGGGRPHPSGYGHIGNDISKDVERWSKDNGRTNPFPTNTHPSRGRKR